MKQSGHRKLLCELSKLSKFNAAINFPCIRSFYRTMYTCDIQCFINLTLLQYICTLCTLLQYICTLCTLLQHIVHFVHCGHLILHINILDVQNIVKLLGVCTRNEPVYTVMEYMLYGDLKTYLLARRHLVNERNRSVIDASVTDSLVTDSLVTNLSVTDSSLNQSETHRSQTRR